MTDDKNLQTASELKREVELWVDRTFNFIQLEVYEKMSDNCLIEHIEQAEIDYAEFLTNYSLWDEFYEYYFTESDIPKKAWQNEKEFAEKECKKTCGGDWNKYFTHDSNGNYNPDNELESFCENEQSSSFDSFRDDREGENYPMWNTLFEVRNGNWDTLTEAAKKVGCGIISGLEPFNDTLFMMSCGHSFYGSYWIPMYLEIFETEREKYKGVKYDMM